MARQAIRDHKVVYRPDYVVVPKPFLIDASASPKDEIWRFISICVLLWLNAKGIWTLNKSDMESIEQSSKMRTYKYLLKLVREKRYRRDLSFYLNVRGCAWSACTAVVRDEYMKQQRMRDRECNLADTLSSDSDVTYNDIIGFVPKWRTDAEKTNKVSYDDFSQIRNRIVQSKSIIRIVDNAYEDYVEDCLELGIGHVSSKEEFVKQNYSEDEIRLYKSATGEIQPKYGSQEYYRAYYRRNKKRKKEGC